MKSTVILNIVKDLSVFEHCQKLLGSCTQLEKLHNEDIGPYFDNIWRTA